jgi:GDP-L-fucose synthase
MKEEYLLTGPLEPTNEGYALAKIAGLKMAEYIFKQHQIPFICPMPCNLYGTNDHFDANSHVLSATVKRFVDALDDKIEEVTMWGTGSARREFLHVNDCAEACLFLFEKMESPEIINVGCGTDVSIKELAEMVARLVGWNGKMNWDTTKPDGMPRKCLDTTKLTNMGWTPKISLEEGIKSVIKEYRHLKANPPAEVVKPERPERAPKASRKVKAKK